MENSAACQSQRSPYEPISRDTFRQVIEITTRNIDLTSSALLALRRTNQDLNQIVNGILCKTDIEQEFPLRKLKNIADIKSLNCRGFYNHRSGHGDLWEIGFDRGDPFWLRALKCLMLFYKPFNRFKFRLRQFGYRSSGGQLLDAELHNLQTLPSLQHLRLENLRFITDRGLIEIAKLSQLRLLSLRNCHNITGRGIGNLSCLHQLESIDLTGKTPYQLEQSGALEALTELPQLQEVILGPIWQSQLEILSSSKINHKFKALEIHCVTSDIFETLTNLPLLERLTLTAFAQNFSPAIAAPKISGLHHLHTFEFLNEFCGIEQLSTMFDVLAAMPQLTSLNLGEFDQSDVESLLQLTQLQKLSIERDQSSFSSELDAFSKLKYLKLGWPTTIRDDIWLSISALETLELRSEFTTLLAITSLRHLPKLTSLDLSQAIFPKNFDLHHLADLEALRKLNLSDCESSREDDRTNGSDLVPKLPIPLPNLEILIFRGKTISKVQFDFIANFPKLIELDLARSEFDIADLQKLRDDRPRLCIQLTCDLNSTS